MSKSKARTPTSKSIAHRSAPSEAPEWLQKYEHVFLRTGKLNLSAVELPDLAAIKARFLMKELNISKTKLTSLKGLAIQRNITVFNADNSALESFVNFSSIANASIYSFKNTPLSQDRLHRLAIVLLSNSKNPIVNGTLISENEKKKAEGYPPFVGELVNLGWPLVYPCPEPDQLRELCRDYNVTYVEDAPAEEALPAAELAPSDHEIADADYLAQIDYLMGQHDDVILRATKRFDLLDESEEKFQAEMKDLLSKGTRWSFADGEDLDDQILAAVTSLCLARGRQ
jgi:hypothetical protein